MRLFIFYCLLFISISSGYSQEISLYEQFNGRYDYTAIGNTLNPAENNLSPFFCNTLSQSSATLNLAKENTITAAYLFWAGSGESDDTVLLNDIPVTQDNSFSVDYLSTIGHVNFFSNVSDVTTIIQTIGNDTYTLKDLDVSNSLATNSTFCRTRTNFAGWAIYIIYENDSLPLNQVNLFLGMEIINRSVPEKIITLDNLNILDNDGAKIGFLAWEGDNALNYGESLSLNGVVLSNPPLNNPDNAFNGTNTFTNSSNFYNVDLDVYDVENIIKIGDTEAQIKLTTGAQVGNSFFADLIILNNIITVFNSQLPDATITIDALTNTCNSNRLLQVDYTVYNTNSTDPLPTNTPIAIYANNILVGNANTLNIIDVGGSETGTFAFNVATSIPDNFTLKLVVDDTGSSTGVVVENNENNNETSSNVSLIPEPLTFSLGELNSCDIGFGKSLYNLEDATTNSVIPSGTTLFYYKSLDDLNTNTNEILIPTNFEADSLFTKIYVKAETVNCFNIYTITLKASKCPPVFPEWFTPNNDGYNDYFNVLGLYNIYLNHKLQIFNRYGVLIFEGNNSKKWYGKANRGILKSNKKLPTGTYYYVLHLNQDNLPPLNGWVYIN